MSRIGVVLTDEMDDALKRIAGKRGATISNLVRIALLEWLEANGEKIEDVGLRWGGSRTERNIDADEALWDQQFAASQDALKRMALQALQEDEAGLTEDFDPNNDPDAL